MKKSLLLFGIFLTGCSTAAQQEFNRIKSVNQSASQAINACYAQLNSNPEFTSLQKLLYTGDGVSAPIEYLTLKSKPTKAELATYKKRLTASQQCEAIALNYANQAHPMFGPVMQGCQTKAKDLALEFLDGQMTWGDLNKRREANAQACQAALTAIDMQVGSALQEAHQAEAANRAAAWQRAAASFQQQQYQQQMLYNMNRPINTNCNAFGNSVNCTTY